MVGDWKVCSLSIQAINGQNWSLEKNIRIEEREGVYFKSQTIIIIVHSNQLHKCIYSNLSKYGTAHQLVINSDLSVKSM